MALGRVRATDKRGESDLLRRRVYLLPSRGGHCVASSTGTEHCRPPAAMLTLECSHMDLSVEIAIAAITGTKPLFLRCHGAAL